MNKNRKYCFLFLVFTLLLIAGIGAISAANNNTDDTGITDNTIQKVETTPQNVVSTNNEKEKTEITKNEVQNTIKTDEKTTNTTSKKEITKTNKTDVKTADIAITITLTPNSGKVGDQVTLVTSKQSILNSNLNCIVSIDGEQFYTVTKRGSNQVITLNFAVPDKDPGVHTISLKASFSSINCVGSTSFTIESTAIDTQISQIAPVNGKVGSTVIPVTVKDINNNDLEENSTLTFKDGDNILLDNVPISNGVANVSVPTERIGTYPITVIFNENKFYRESNTTVTVNVSKANSKFVIEDQNGNITVANNTVITGKLLTEENAPIKNKSVIIDVDGLENTIITDNEGNFVYAYPISQLGSHTYEVKFAGTDLYNGATSVNGNFNVNAFPITITLDPVALSEVNETTTISGIVSDTTNTVVKNLPITLFITPLNETRTATTDNYGEFTCDLIFNEPQTVTVLANNNNTLYSTTPAQTTFDVVIGPRRTNLTLNIGEGTGKTIKFTNVQPYHTIEITNGTLLDKFNEPVVNAQITVLINNEAIPTTTDTNGKFSIIYNATQGLTTYTISAKFEGNDAYKPASEVYSGQFTTKALNLSAILDENLNPEYLIGDKVQLRGVATFEEGKYANQPVIIIIDGTQYTNNTDVNGNFEYTYVITRNGTIPVTATINNPQAVVANNTLNIYVSKPDVSVIFDPIDNGRVKLEKTITGKLYINSNDTGIKDSITFIINGATEPIETNNDGTFTYTFTPQTTGTYEVSVKFSSEKYVTTFEDSQTFEITKLSTQIINNPIPVAVNLYDNIIFSGQLVDEYNTPVTNAEIKITINDNTVTNTTDNNGYYTYTYTANTIGDNNLYEIRYSGDANYDLARNYVGSFFDVEAKSAKINITATNVDKRVETTSYITGYVTDENNEPLNAVNVTIRINDEEYSVTTTDGVYTFSYEPTESGNISVTATLNSSEYIPVTAKTVFNVIESEQIIIQPVEATITQETTVTTTLNNFDETINEGYVIFKLNGKTLRDENGNVIYVPVVNGAATLNYNFTKNQLKNGGELVSVYSGTENYDPIRSDAFTLTIEEETATIVVENIYAVPEETITLTAQVTSNNLPVNEGKIVFKLNGKSLKDADGKLLTATVNNGTATAQYQLTKKLKPKEYNITAVYSSNIYERTEASATLTIGSADTLNTSTNSINRKTPTTTKNEGPQTIIINQETVTTYLTNNGLTTAVSAGDTLDFQGTITRGNGLTKILINKPVNIITSTHDGRIENFDEITFNSYSSGSNVTGLYTYDTQFYVKTASNIVFDNITNNVSTKVVGRDVGQTSIRENSQNITIKNSLFYTKDTQSSTLVFAWADNSLVDNCTIIGEGAVGNLFYYTRYNVNNIPSGVVPNTNNIFRNSRIIGPSQAQPICYGIGISGKNILIENNTITYSGTGITRQSDAGSSSNPTDFENITIRYNELHGGCGIGAVPNLLVYNNTIYDNGELVTGTGTYFNNTVYGSLSIYSTEGLVENNTATSARLYTDVRLVNNIINGDVNVLPPDSYRSSSSNTLVANNTISGNIIVKGYSTGNLAQNNIIMENNVTGNIALTNSKGTIVQNNRVKGGISLTYSDTNTVRENEVNGTISMVNTSPYNVIINNRVITTNNFAVTVANRLNNITDNYLVSSSYSGNQAVQDTSTGGRALVERNGPFPTLIVTMDTYNNFFNNNGIFNASLVDYGNVALQGEFNGVVMKFRSGIYNVHGFDENTVLKDSIIIASENSKLNISNITLTITNNNTFNNTALKLESAGNTVENVNIRTEESITEKVEAAKVLNNNTNIKNTVIEIESMDDTTTAISLENVGNVVITENNITVNGGNAVTVGNSNNSQVVNNYLNTTQGKNNYAVNVDESSENITVESNTPNRNTVSLNADPVISGTVLDNSTIIVAVVDEIDGTVSTGRVIILINDLAITDQTGETLVFEVADNKITLENYVIPSGWLRSDANITFKFLESGLYEEAIVTSDLNISKRDAVVEIMTLDLTSNASESIVLTAKVTDNDEVVSSGRVAFKLNGKTLTDNEDNLIFVDVVDGFASLTYNVPSEMAQSEYMVSAVFENSLYNRCEATSTLSVL